MKRMLGVCVVVVLLVAGAADAGRKFVWVRVSRANLRSAPTTQSAIVGQAAFGDRLLAVANGDDWLRIRLQDGREAYIWEDLVTDDHPGRLWVDDDFAALRALPEESAQVVTTLDRGTQLACVGKGDDWYKVRTADGRAGWIADDAIDDDPPDTLFVRVAEATLHAEPRAESEAVGQVGAGNALVELDRQLDFYRIRTPSGTEGWVFRAAVTEDVPFTVFVDAVEGKVRSQRIPGAAVVATVRSGTELVAFDEDDDWYFVRTSEGALGWISDDEALYMGGR